MFCTHCGKEIVENSKVCSNCGENLNYPAQDLEKKMANNQYESPNRSRLVAGILQLFLGAFGVGRFYLGYIGIGTSQVLVNIITFGVGGMVWGFVDAMMILTGQVEYDAWGRPLNK